MKHRALLLLPGLLAGALPAAALTPADLQRCRALADERARLACYDALAGAPAAVPAPQPAATPPSVPPATAAAPARVAPAVETEADFGRSAAGTPQIESRIAGPFEGWHRQTRFRLANGQVWQVVDGSSAALALRDPQVRIRRAALGSFLMEIEGSNRTVRVRRVE